MGEKVTIEVDLASCMHVKLERSKALDLINAIIEAHGITKDLEETIRVVRNFDEYYQIARRRFETYIVIPKDVSESIRGRTVVSKVRLIREGDLRIVELVFDKRVPQSFIVEMLEKVGFKEVEIKEVAT